MMSWLWTCAKNVSSFIRLMGPSLNNWITNGCFTAAIMTWLRDMACVLQITTNGFLTKVTPQLHLWSMNYPFGASEFITDYSGVRVSQFIVFLCCVLQIIVCLFVLFKHNGQIFKLTLENAKMNNPEKQTTFAIQDTERRQAKHKAHHYRQTNTNNVNKT